MVLIKWLAGRPRCLIGAHHHPQLQATKQQCRRSNKQPASSAHSPPSSGLPRPTAVQGNVLVDVPRWTPLLARRLEELGGVAWILLTHRDDVSDHAAWAAHFGARRVIHRLEANRRQGTE